MIPTYRIDIARWALLGDQKTRSIVFGKMVGIIEWVMSLYDLDRSLSFSFMNEPDSDDVVRVWTPEGKRHPQLEREVMNAFDEYKPWHIETEDQEEQPGYEETVTWH